MRALSMVATEAGFPGWGRQVSCDGVLWCLLSVSPMPARSGFEEGGTGPRKEHARSDSENWRSLREEQEEDGSWRLGAGPRRDGDRWRSTSPGKMGQGGVQELLPMVNVADVGEGDGHTHEEWEHPREAMLGARPAELEKADPGVAGH